LSVSEQKILHRDTLCRILIYAVIPARPFLLQRMAADQEAADGEQAAIQAMEATVVLGIFSFSGIGAIIFNLVMWDSQLE
jgi:hypothetical protein